MSSLIQAHFQLNDALRQLSLSHHLSSRLTGHPRVHKSKTIGFTVLPQSLKHLSSQVGLDSIPSRCGLSFEMKSLLLSTLMLAVRSLFCHRWVKFVWAHELPDFQSLNLRSYFSRMPRTSSYCHFTRRLREVSLSFCSELDPIRSRVILR